MEQGQQQVKVWKQFGKNGELLLETEMIDANRFPEGVEPAKVAYWGSAKVNTGNYENVDCGVSISVPCYLEDAEGAYEYAKKFVSDRLQEELDGIRKFLAESKTK